MAACRPSIQGYASSPARLPRRLKHQLRYPGIFLSSSLTQALLLTTTSQTPQRDDVHAKLGSRSCLSSPSLNLSHIHPPQPLIPPSTSSSHASPHTPLRPPRGVLGRRCGRWPASTPAQQTLASPADLPSPHPLSLMSFSTFSIASRDAYPSCPICFKPERCCASTLCASLSLSSGAPLTRDVQSGEVSMASRVWVRVSRRRVLQRRGLACESMLTASGVMSSSCRAGRVHEPWPLATPMRCRTRPSRRGCHHGRRG